MISGYIAYKNELPQFIKIFNAWDPAYKVCNSPKFIQTFQFKFPSSLVKTIIYQ